MLNKHLKGEETLYVFRNSSHWSTCDRIKQDWTRATRRSTAFDAISKGLPLPKSGHSRLPKQRRIYEMWWHERQFFSSASWTKASVWCFEFRMYSFVCYFLSCGSLTIGYCTLNGCSHWLMFYPRRLSMTCAAFLYVVVQSMQFTQYFFTKTLSALGDSESGGDRLDYGK